MWIAITGITMLGPKMQSGVQEKVICIQMFAPETTFMCDKHDNLKWKTHDIS